MKTLAILVAVLLVLGGGSLSGQAKSLSEERLETLKFGIEAEILDLIKLLRGEKDERLDGELAGLLVTTKRPALSQALLEYFAENSSPRAEEPASQLVKNWENENQLTVAAAVKYLGIIKSKRAYETIVGFLERTDRLASAALAFLGRTAAVESAGGILKMLERKDLAAELRIEAVGALGEMKAAEAYERLNKMVGDADEDLFLRRKACEALGRLKDARALPALKAAFESSDVFLRAAALGALAAIGGAGVENILADGLRDSSYRVRLAAAEAAGEAPGDGLIEALIYKSRRDPEKAVQRASVKALARAGGGKAMAFLRGVLVDEKASGELRMTAALELIAFRAGEAAADLEKAAGLEWKNEKSVLLEVIARAASQKSEAGLARLYEKLLDHPSLTMKLYGLRGARINKLGSLKPKISAFLDEKNHPQLRKTAADVLKDL